MSLSQKNDTGKVSCSARGNLARSSGDKPTLAEKARTMSANRATTAAAEVERGEYEVLAHNPYGRTMVIRRRRRPFWKQDADAHAVNYRDLTCDCMDFNGHIARMNRRLELAGMEGTLLCRHVQIAHLLSHDPIALERAMTPIDYEEYVTATATTDYTLADAVREDR